jgi:hypothetical protein
MKKFTKESWELSKAERRTATITGLQALASWIKANPEIEIPANFSNIVFFRAEETDIHAKFAEIAKAAPFAEKNASETYFTLKLCFSETVYIEYYTTREAICERVQVGTRFVEATEARVVTYETVPAHEEPIYEYKCPSLLAPQEPIEDSEPSSEPSSEAAEAKLLGRRPSSQKS